MINSTAVLKRVKTMVDGSVVAEFDFGEHLLSSFDGMLKQPLMVVIMTEDEYTKQKQDSELDKNRKIHGN